MRNLAEVKCFTGTRQLKLLTHYKTTNEVKMQNFHIHTTRLNENSLNNFHTLIFTSDSIMLSISLLPLTYLLYTLLCLYNTRCYFNVRSKANTSRLNLPHGTDNQKVF